MVIYVDQIRHVNMLDCVLTNNVRDDGGLMSAFYTTIVITSCSIDHNTADPNGGMIYSDHTTLKMTDFHMYDNPSNPAGVVCGKDATQVITIDCTDDDIVFINERRIQWE